MANKSSVFFFPCSISHICCRRQTVAAGGIITHRRAKNARGRCNRVSCVRQIAVDYANPRRNVHLLFDVVGLDFRRQVSRVPHSLILHGRAVHGSDDDFVCSSERHREGDVHITHFQRFADTVRSYLVPICFWSFNLRTFSRTCYVVR